MGAVPDTRMQVATGVAASCLQLDRRQAWPARERRDFAKTHTSVSGIDDSDAVEASDDQ